MFFAAKSYLFTMLLLLSFNVFASATIDVLTFNTWMIPLQGKLPLTRGKLIGENVSHFDLVFLQEVFSKKVRNKILANTDEQFLGLYIPKRGRILGSGLMNLTKYEVTQKSFLPFKACGCIQCAAAKGILYMQVKLPNGYILDTFSTHLQAYEKEANIRKRQLKELMNFIQRKNDGSNPVLLVGDFNVIASTDEYKTLSNYLIGYTDSWLDLRPSEDGYTWDPDVNTWAEYDRNESVQQQRIDYIFVKDGKTLKWNVLNIELMFDQLFQKMSGGIFLSDHFGLAAKLELSE